MTHMTTMTSKGQVTVPVSIRRKLGLQPGRPVRFSISGASVKIENADWENDLKALHQRIKVHMKRKNLKFPAAEDWQNVRERAWDEAAVRRLHSSEE